MHLLFFELISYCYVTGIFPLTSRHVFLSNIKYACVMTYSTFKKYSVILFIFAPFKASRDVSMNTEHSEQCL